MALHWQALGPSYPLTAGKVRPRSLYLSADNPIARELKVAASLAADNHRGRIVVLIDDKTRELSIDLVVGKGAAELSAQIASGPTIDPHQRWRRIKPCRRKSAPIGSRCWRDAQCNSGNSDREPHRHHAPSPSFEVESFC